MNKQNREKEIAMYIKELERLAMEAIKKGLPLTSDEILILNRKVDEELLKQMKGWKN